MKGSVSSAASLLCLMISVALFADVARKRQYPQCLCCMLSFFFVLVSCVVYHSPTPAPCTPHPPLIVATSTWFGWVLTSASFSQHPLSRISVSSAKHLKYQEAQADWGNGNSSALIREPSLWLPNHSTLSQQLSWLGNLFSLKWGLISRCNVPKVRKYNLLLSFRDKSTFSDYEGKPTDFDIQKGSQCGHVITNIDWLSRPKRVLNSYLHKLVQISCWSKQY